ncbi:MAG: HAMP domain-containing histidine kinase [Rickettsiales bacterium]|nr:MAG: HAMP domain-containing histidine kinase [Rickettsiales bacterium]
MDKKTSNINIDQIDQQISIKMITFGVVMIVIILTLVSFVHIYSSKKGEVFKDMQTESTQLKIIIADNLNYSKYFIDIIGKHVKNDYKNLNLISTTLKDHFYSQDFNMLFGWRKYSWINNHLMETVNSTTGILVNPKHVDYIEKISIQTKNDRQEDKITFYHKKGNDNSLKIINNIFDNVTKEYIGSVILSYDIRTLIQSLNIRKKSKSTNFIILNEKLEIVAQSKPYIENLINTNFEMTQHLKTTLQNYSNSKLSDDVLYLDMANGLNYFISHLQGLPFILIINTDSSVIKKEILNDVIKSFVLVCIFASLSLFVIIFIYKRETYLRTKAEKASQVAEDVTKAKTNFLAFTAHEIRSPLGFILTGSEMMIKELFGKLSADYIKYAEGIHENSKVILDFITDILDENQIIEGKFKIINATHKIDSIIDEAIQVTLARFNKRNVPITIELEKNIPLLICDKRRLIQVLSNLISNSIKYSEDNTNIIISAKIVNGEMKISVKDHGFGMKESEIPQALDAYGTLHDHSDYYSIESYGLGLAIVKMLLEAHDAELNISSIKNKGTVVQMTFPKYKLIYTNIHSNNNKKV